MPKLSERAVLLGGFLLLASGVPLVGCGGGSEADRAYVGGECTATADCGDSALACLTNFRGGYCGIVDCTGDADCLEGSICVTQGNTNYCFLVCNDKAECNTNRTAANESNCSSNIVRVDGGTQRACVPPSGT